MLSFVTSAVEVERTASDALVEAFLRPRLFFNGSDDAAILDASSSPFGERTDFLFGKALTPLPAMA